MISPYVALQGQGVWKSLTRGESSTARAVQPRYIPPPMHSPEWPGRSHFSELLGFVLEQREDGTAKVAVVVEPRHANTMGVAHGGLLTSLMDTACGAAIAYQPSIGGKGVMTVSIQVSYLGPTKV